MNADPYQATNLQGYLSPMNPKNEHNCSFSGFINDGYRQRVARGELGDSGGKGVEGIVVQREERPQTLVFVVGRVVTVRERSEP